MRGFWALLSALVIAGSVVLLVPKDDVVPVASMDARSEPSSPPAEVPAPSSTAVDERADESADEPTVATPTLDPGGVGKAVGESAAAPLLVDPRSPLEITRRIDARTLELDGRFRLVGNGTGDDPYRISWELLTSASRYVDPARGSLVPPPWVRAIDGACVEISAYYSSAVRVQFARHLLLTLNRWDGCCIGLPPTPFDAIDVSMREPVSLGGLHLVRFGTFRGRLVVEPLDVAGYLIGLYRLEDATFEAR